MDLNQELLTVIASKLQSLGEEFVTEVTFDADRVIACDGNLRLEAHIESDHSLHDELLHCHVVAQIGSDQSQNIDACIVGVGTDDDGKLEDAAQSWVSMVGAPILSLLNQASLMGAEHFDGTSGIGIKNAHGFVGPKLGRFIGEGFDWEQMDNDSLFRFAESLAAPEPLQLAKVVVNANEGRWSRTLEINGHSVSFYDGNWDAGVAAPEFGTFSQFAIFHFANDPDWLDARQKIDDAICHFVAAFQETQNIESSLSKIIDLGVEKELAHRLHYFVSLAFSRALFEDLGAEYSPTYQAIQIGGKVIEENLLMDDPVFARSFAMAIDFQSGDLAESFKTIALLNTEFNQLNDLLNKGQTPESICLPPPVIPEFGTTPECIDKAMKKVLKKDTPCS